MFSLTSKSFFSSLSSESLNRISAIFSSFFALSTNSLAIESILHRLTDYPVVFLSARKYKIIFHNFLAIIYFFVCEHLKEFFFPENIQMHRRYVKFAFLAYLSPYYFWIHCIIAYYHHVKVRVASVRLVRITASYNKYKKFCWNVF